MQFILSVKLNPKIQTSFWDSSYSIIAQNIPSFLLLQTSFFWHKTLQTTLFSRTQKIFILTLCFTIFWYLLGLILDLIWSEMSTDWLNTRSAPDSLDTVEKWSYNKIKRRGNILEWYGKKRRMLGVTFSSIHQHSFFHKVGYSHEYSLVQPWFHSGHMNNKVYISIHCSH